MKNDTNKKAVGSGFACMECGHRFPTLKAAERAAFGPNGCPKCGAADIDLADSDPRDSKIADDQVIDAPTGKLVAAIS